MDKQVYQNVCLNSGHRYDSFHTLDSRVMLICTQCGNDCFEELKVKDEKPKNTKKAKR